MPNRSMFNSANVPVIYQPVPPHYPFPRKHPAPPHKLDLFDVTFLHFHNTMEIGLCLEGDGICYVNSQEYVFHAGDIQIVLPYQSHITTSTGSTPSQWYWINVDPTDLLAQIGFSKLGDIEQMLLDWKCISGIISPELNPSLHEVAVQLIQEITLPHAVRHNPDIFYSAYVYMLIAQLQQTCATSETSETSETQSAEQHNSIQLLAPALQEIKTQIDNGIIPKADSLCTLCSMSVATFRRKFTATFGHSPKEYIIACCISRSCRLLLRTDKKISEIAGMCGFQDISGFNKCFLKNTGTTPSLYRKYKTNSTVE